MAKFMQSLALTMISIGCLSFLLMFLSFSTAETHLTVSFWNNGWGLIWGGSILLVLDSIRELLAAPLK